eukprot:CAMPEP_0114586598 /NCGR_PEP_ID=MMETSP0125-20121206/9771_1 /TAXON_ID=485358 ORGANISM="Aristerostoma sp., Strain ATCC 50986" /NCGR_SAMPLE_ID=MMETSP0125 /ASSEMBLY_ACC=CAM_ASM_000245 /LENGTH=58 /DNA_ID=CAMNT_0001782095 /DNA_START=1 /DNA_END=177 /DNA_ORIENTATION=-
MGKKGKKGKKGRREVEPDDDLMDKDGDTLKSLITQYKERLAEVKSKRNYIQNDRDMVE